MKRRQILKAAKKFGWELLRHGSEHDIYTNGKQQVSVPRHNEVKETTGAGIIRTMEKHPGQNAR